MSIYPVRLNEWFPVGDAMHEHAASAASYARCFACGSKPRFRKAWGHHSVPWGYGDIWCDEKCLLSRKKSRGLDKRQRRKLKRWFKRFA